MINAEHFLLIGAILLFAFPNGTKLVALEIQLDRAFDFFAKHICNILSK